MSSTNLVEKMRSPGATVTIDVIEQAVAAALADLEFSRKRIARDVRKCLESAIANAENNHDLDVDSLIVSEAYVGKKLVMKRLKAGARGRSSRIEKPFAQITVIVRQVEEPA